MLSAERIKITVVGSGYVGTSLSVILAQHNDVTLLDIDAERVDMINNKQSTVEDKEIELFLADKQLTLIATSDAHAAYEGASFVIVATPTNFDTKINRFDTSSVDTVVEEALKLNPDALVVIKSTVPVGHTKLLQKKFKTERVIFSPEFLREGQALKDNLYPSRIIIGSKCKAGKEFANLLKQSAEKIDIEMLFMRSSEAEAVKLFANTYLAMRVSFFNELDSYALAKNINSKDVINGVCLDERIGNEYNNPSFGYGGYCLPKDTRQLLANYEAVPQSLIGAVVSSNSIRKDFIANEILKNKPKIVGVYGLVMKEGSDNFRSSAIIGLMNRIRKAGIDVIIFEPRINEPSFDGIKVINSLSVFKGNSDIIVANRDSKNLQDVRHKVFTRDVFNIN